MARKLPDTDLQNLPACAAKFIKLVIKKMRYRKKVRSDVQAELVAHFKDELKDCKTDEQRQQKAERLIADFGDAKLLAVLLRRAKKRCRPLWRTVFARTCQVIVILFICFILYVAWFLTGKPVVTTDYVAQLNRIVRPVADESMNAATLYEKAAELYKGSTDEEFSKLLQEKYGETTPEEKQRIEKWIAENNKIFDLIMTGAQKPYYWQEYKGDAMMAILIPNLADFRKLAKALRWKIWLAAEQGRYEGAFTNIKVSYKLGQQLKGDVILIEQLVGIAIETLAVGTLRDVLGEYEIDSPKLATLQEDFEQMIASEDFKVSLKAEKLFMYDEIQRCFTEDRFGGGHLYPSRVMALGALGNGNQLSTYEIIFEVISSQEGWLGAAQVLFFHPNKQETLQMVESFYDFLEVIVPKTPGQMHIEEFDPEKEAMTIIKGNMLLEFLTPALWKVSELGHRVKMDVEATLTLIAILRYRQDKGGYPENLEELITGGYLKRLPIDAWSDKPLVYRATDNNFILYSIGRNFEDDGGERGKDEKGRVRLWTDDGDWVFWPVPQN